MFAYAQTDGSWWINTTGFIVGTDRVTAVDSCATEARTRLLLDTVRRTAGRPVRTLVNTHFHGDHTHGNSLFTDATIIGHERCRAGMLRLNLLLDPPREWAPAPEWGDLTLTPPDVTFTDTLTLWVGGREVRLIYVGGPAHTDSDIVVWLPAERLLFAGDLAFNGGTPMMLMGSITGSLRAMAMVRTLGATTVVPGHGRPTGPDVFDGHERYARFVLAVASEAMAAGITPLDAARDVDLGEFADLLDPERIVLNLHRAYLDLADDADGARHRMPNIPAAFADAVAWNGGQPLRCLV